MFKVTANVRHRPMSSTSSFSDPAGSKRLIVAAGVTTSIAGLISAGHHWYGAVIYDTMWRTAVSYWILAAVLFAVFLLNVYWRRAHNASGKLALWLFFLSAVVFQTGFTLFECVYSHVLKGLLFFAGTSRSALEQLFPPPAYHLPDNALFELTGWLQLAGFVAAWYGYCVFRDRPWANSVENSTLVMDSGRHSRPPI